MIYTQKIVNLSSCLQILHFRQIMVNIACMNKDLKQLVKEECKFMPSDALVERFLGAMEEIQVKPRRRIIDFGKICTDVFCVKSGIVRLFHVDDAKESTFGFASPGTIFMSPLSFYLDAPAFLMAETCKIPATLLRMNRATFYSFINGSDEFARWMFSLASAQICICERKLSLINGSAMERYQAVLKNRPEIVEAVTDRVLASYLEITPQHLCRLKQQLRDKHSKSPVRPPPAIRLWRFASGDLSATLCPACLPAAFVFACLSACLPATFVRASSSKTFCLRCLPTPVCLWSVSLPLSVVRCPGYCSGELPCGGEFRLHLTLFAAESSTEKQKDPIST